MLIGVTFGQMLDIFIAGIICGTLILCVFIYIVGSKYDKK